MPARAGIRRHRLPAGFLYRARANLVSRKEDIPLFDRVRLLLAGSPMRVFRQILWRRPYRGHRSDVTLIDIEEALEQGSAGVSA